jgi:hypothetical protein
MGSFGSTERTPGFSGKIDDHASEFWIPGVRPIPFDAAKGRRVLFLYHPFPPFSVHKTASTGFGGFLALISNEFGTRWADQSIRLKYPCVIRKEKRFPASEPDVPHCSQHLHILQTPLN